MSDGVLTAMRATRFYYLTAVAGSAATAWDFSALSGYDARRGALEVWIKNTSATQALRYKLYPIGVAVSAESLADPVSGTPTEVHELAANSAVLFSVRGAWSGIVYQRDGAVDAAIQVEVLV